MHRSISLLFWPGKVRSSWLLPDLADVLLLEDAVLSSCSHQVWCSLWPSRFYGRTFSHTVPAHLYWPAMQKRHKYWCRQNIGARQDFTDFCQNFCQYLCSQASYQKLVKQKAITITVQCQFFYSWPPYRGRHRYPRCRLMAVPMGKGCLVGGGGRHASVLITSIWRGTASKHA